MEEEKKIVLYTIGCPHCKALETMFDKKGIKYETCSDEGIIAEKGAANNMKSAPFIEMNGQFYSYKDSVKMLNQGGFN